MTPIEHQTRRQILAKLHQRQDFYGVDLRDPINARLRRERRIESAAWYLLIGILFALALVTILH